jgi:probable HAF family extracellular repeat protein
MSAIDDFRNAKSVKLSSITYYYAPPAVSREMEGERTTNAFCINKDPGLALIIQFSNLLRRPEWGDFPIPLTNASVFPGPGGDPIIQWQIDDRPHHIVSIPAGWVPAFDATIEHVTGSISVVLNAIDPAENDSLCDGTPAPYFVRLTTVSTDTPSNFLNFTVSTPYGSYTYFTSNLRFIAKAGIMVMDPAHLLRVDIGPATHRICHPYAERRVLGTVTLDRSVQRAQAPSGRLPYTLTAQPHDGPPLRVEPPSHGVTVGFHDDNFSVIVPAAFSGDVDVTAQLGGETSTQVLTVESPDPSPGPYPEIRLLGCLPQELYLVERPLIEEGIEYRFRDLNDLGDLIGYRNGVAFRYLAEGYHEYFGQLIGNGASIESINNLSQVAGGIIDVNGKITAFIYGGERGVGKAGLGTVKNAYFTALNDTGQAVGFTLAKGQQQAVLYLNGKIGVLSMGSKSSTAIAINNRGLVAINSMTSNDEQHTLLYQSGKLQDISESISRPSVASALNENGVVVGYSIGKDGKHEAFAYSNDSSTLIELKGVTGFDDSQANDINDDGVIVGTAFSAEQSRKVPIYGFRYTTKGGMENLNDVLQNDQGIVVIAALKINNAGEILVFGLSKDKQGGYFLIGPANKQ